MIVSAHPDACQRPSYFLMATDNAQVRAAARHLTNTVVVNINDEIAMSRTSRREDRREHRDRQRATLQNAAIRRAKA